MTRMLIVVEGQTEEQFVKAVLAPHLLAHGVFATATIVGTPKKRDSAPLSKGGGDWGAWKRDIQHALGRAQTEVRVTTMFDLYGLPPNFPGLAEHGEDPNTSTRCERLEAALAEEIGDHRFRPYLQRHEFEALVLPALGALRSVFDARDDLAGLDRLAKDIEGRQPEDVNDGTLTAPSKRLLKHVPSYRKYLHGPNAIAETGLGVVRDVCPRFDAWIAGLEDWVAGRPRTT